MLDDEIWYRDAAVLVKRPLEFFPTRDHSDAERTNALVRFVLYAALAVALAGLTAPAQAAAAAGAIILVISLVFLASPRGPAQTLEEPKEEQFTAARSCTRPTPENPFMNVLVTEYGTARPPACDYEDVKDDVHRFHERGLHREITDVYKNRASDRQFITMPVTETAPDTTAFRNYLYGAVQRCPDRRARGVSRVPRAIENLVPC